MSPALASQLKGIPVIGQLVDILQFTDGEAEGGSITDGSDVSSISRLEENGFEKIVIGFTQNDELQADAGAFMVSYAENPYTMQFEIGGARGFSAQEQFAAIKESPYVKDVYPLMTLDDSLIRFIIEFTRPVDYEVMEMKDPASIVLYVKEGEQAVETTTYSLRTQSYPYGEAIGHLEERLMDADPSRMLKDAEGMYFIEVQQFDTEEEAVQKRNELAVQMDDVTLFVEERRGVEAPVNDPAQTEKTNEGDAGQSEAELEAPAFFQSPLKKTARRMMAISSS
ncbi:DUF4179 domain-containing protein [Bacillaceae bacterium SIJ1]|uniref:DUF4179 domain-containing protein n=1 Tax=Litoribacterium kuwaitense TaxID=1398745 RepID=UPI0013EC4ADF|nr:DUF4179 domain-containing protein [Litoribacterium kuwaitense]NGP45694.1 DUF4179 domain-containing protein [Litoribacterium kuwaitense]